MPGILSVVETAYRATVEEQDDTILWINHMFKNAGADVDILLRANAVNYAVKGQDAGGLSFGGMKMSVPPTIDKDVEEMAKAGINVYVVDEDLRDRGIGDDELVSGVKKVKRGDLAGLFDQHATVWHW